MRSFWETPSSLWAAIILLTTIAAAVQFPFALNHDAAWHFYTAFRALDGDRIGIDIADVNPPMSMWLLGLPAFVARISGLPPAAVLRGYVLLLQLAALLCALAMLRRLSWTKSALTTAAVALCAVLLFMPGYHFAQREHIAVALTLPYALLLALRAERQPVRLSVALAVGAVAATGIGIKPYFLAVPACLELWHCWRRRSITLWRPELAAMAAVGALYLLAVVVYAPAYLEVIVPNALLAYGGFEVSGFKFALRAGTYLAASACALVLAVRLWWPERLPAAVQVFIVAGVGFLIAGLMQRKGWQYQIMPAALYWTAAAGLLFATMDRRPKALLALLAIACLQPVVPFVADGLARQGTTARVDALSRLFSSPNHAPVFAFITSPRDIHPAVLQSGARWPDAFGALIYLPAHVQALARAAQDEQSARAVALSENYNKNLLARLERDPPAVLAFDAASDKLGFPIALRFDYLRFFQRYAAFNRLMEAYTETSPIGRFRIFLHTSNQYGEAAPPS